jgi:monofunctional biosynthetic peptidoglycan transglycosylase
MSLLRRTARALALTLLGAVLASLLAVLALRFVPPLTTAFILQARVAALFAKGAAPDFRREWRPIEAISPQLQLAVVASEDQRFADHQGFDFGQIRKAMEEADRGSRQRGASTISQQVAKNLFLWGGHSWLRKGLEAWFTVLIETVWPKQRIMEVYLNSVEFGTGIYGAEAASQTFFNKPASKLNPSEAARLAAVLPNPHKYKAKNPGNYVVARQGWILRQMNQMGGTELVKSFYP